MRTISLTKLLPAAVLGALALTACGAPHADADRTAAGKALPAAAAHAPGADEAELRLMEMTARMLEECAAALPGGGDMSKGEGTPPPDGAPSPESPPGGSGPVTPLYGPGQTPPGTPNADGSIPVELDDPAPPVTNAAPTYRGPVQEVPLTGVEPCVGDRHARRVTQSLREAAPADAAALRAALIELDYPGGRVHQMPTRDATRVDLRFMGGHVALEITGTGPTTEVTPFGAPEGEDVAITTVTRTP
ncbi:hypothetical protein ACH4XT_41120 [Streptomyces avidinii]|uniref:hypothetical protein n=1 Tax=Streptomyces avidinii TaxID=1895 RepID=UPI0037AEA324